uniref:CCDC93 coiled-coil domain-containing protein n=1 Tax=Favella ehrenbergii TaxID=182087 RepID=A0A7S3HYJ4_9SPIT|mmetsp:Transcript_3531/g.4720  ORF Transcript_3531/g.4720 Transcript_3531/m.4720 type:complete len:154 (-) Transcript_3531:149-610(-)
MKITVVQRKIEQCPSNVEITQFTKRMFELFDSFNFKSEENRKYCNLFNTLLDSKKYFEQQYKYMLEISELFRAATKKKERDVLLHNLKNITGIIAKKRDAAVAALEGTMQENRETQQQFDEALQNEKEHFQRIRSFEEACARNEELMERLGGQ